MSSTTESTLRGSSTSSNINGTLWPYKSLKLYQSKMQVCITVRNPTWVSRRRLLEQKLSDLHKCTNLSHVKQIQAQILKSNLHQDLYVAPKLIAAFSLCRQLSIAVNIFYQIQEPNVHLYNTLIRAHIQNYHPSQAFAIFIKMQNSGIKPDNFTFQFLLKACSGKTWLHLVEMIQTHIEKHGFYSDIFVPNALIDSYFKCGPLGVTAAKNLFSMMSQKDIVSWNSMIGGLVKVGEVGEARCLFEEMPERDIVSWNTMLDGCTKAGRMDDAFELFEKMPERNVVSWSTMVSGYCKAGDIDMARILFDKMPVKNLVPWTVIISGYAQKGIVKEAISLYDQMEEARVKPDDATMISILAACAESGLLLLGKKVHSSIEITQFKCTTQVSNALVDMYAKCGKLDKAYSVFNGIEKKDLVTWNSMLQGLAIHGQGEKALQLFDRMKQEGFLPDKVTFIGVLCSCTHAGLVEKGLYYFNKMEREYGIIPEIEHYGCVVDLLGRMGHLKEAFRLVHSMPMEPNDIIRGTLLGACRMHNDVELARDIRDNLVKLDLDTGNFSMLSNVYAAVGDWSNVANVRLRMKNIGIQKPSGASSIDLDNEIYEFTVFDKSHPQSDKIYEMIERLRQDLKPIEICPDSILLSEDDEYLIEWV